MSERFGKELMNIERKKNEMMFEMSNELFDEDEEVLDGFVPSEFKWITLNKQKKRAKELSSKTKLKDK